MIPFHKGVKFITAVRHEKDGKVTYVEQRRTRALEAYTHWVKAWAKATFPKDEKGASAKAEAAIQLVKERGGWPDEKTLCTARAQYQKWKEQNKSRSAKYSRSKLRKKKDERRGARSDKERKALLRDVEHKHGREGAKMFIEESFEQAMQTAKRKTRP
jgi:hypothetical protein